MGVTYIEELVLGKGTMKVYICPRHYPMLITRCAGPCPKCGRILTEAEVYEKDGKRCIRLAESEKAKLSSKEQVCGSEK